MSYKHRNQMNLLTARPQSDIRTTAADAAYATLRKAILLMFNSFFECEAESKVGILSIPRINDVFLSV